ncbi:GNAT family N-acetyltransferase [Streptomyces sp. NPDC050617]|uniref:GNAT family N-acetyltransferase n=1 Tax=Streptomyces sp. NPDC050617 TaxID=3154628 RepID=UPI003430626B
MEIRKGGAGDIPAILGMMDSAVEWLVTEGREGQWGTEPYSSRPAATEKIEDTVGSGPTWIAEVDGEAAGAMTLAPRPSPYIDPADEPEVFVRLLVIDSRFRGRGVGSALLAHAVEETRRQSVGLLRVDCYAGGEGRLVDYYRRNGFTPTETFAVEGWPGQLLARRV